MLLHDELIQTGCMDRTALKEYLCNLVIQHFKAARVQKSPEYLSQEDADEAQIIYSYLKRKKDRLVKYNKL